MRNYREELGNLRRDVKEEIQNAFFRVKDINGDFFLTVLPEREEIVFFDVKLLESEDEKVAEEARDTFRELPYFYIANKYDEYLVYYVTNIRKTEDHTTEYYAVWYDDPNEGDWFEEYEISIENLIEIIDLINKEK